MMRVQGKLVGSGTLAGLWMAPGVPPMISSTAEANLWKISAGAAVMESQTPEPEVMDCSTVLKIF